MFDTPPGQERAWNTIPADPSAYATFVAKVVARYGPLGSFWIQHPDARGLRDPDLRAVERALLHNGNNGNYDPGRYASLVKAAAIAGRQADPAPASCWPRKTRPS